MAISKITTKGIADDSVTSAKLAAGAVTANDIPDTEIPFSKLSQVNLDIAPEVLEIQVAAPDAGQDTAWLWTWEQSTLPYARRTITNSPEISVPLYKQGTYTVNNYAAYDLFGSMTQTHTLYFKWIDGAGTDNLISWAVSTGPVSDSHPDINSGNATDVQRININVPATVTPPTLTAPNVSYSVTNNGAGAYTFSGSAKGDNPNIGPMYRGGTYTFNVNAVGHPFYFTTDNGTNFSAGTYFGEYTSGVTGSRTDNGSVTIVVPNDAPDTLYYQCGNHSSMRGAITIKDLAVEVNNNGNYIVYAQHTQEGHKTPIELRPIPSLVNQMCLVYDAASGKFVPQDLATYVENTPSFENKIREVAGTAELVVEDGSAVIAKVNVYDDSTYLPLVGNNPGDQAFATDTDILYIWDGSAWQQAGAANTDDLAEGTTNLFYTDARVASYLSSNDFDTATNIIASITDSAPATLDTLNELASALGDDPNFATTVTNSIATKANSADVYTQAQVDTALSGKADLTGDSFTGNVTIGGNLGEGLDLNRTGGSAYIRFDSDNARIQSARVGTNGSHLRFRTRPDGGSSTIRMQISENGYVGIGNNHTSPTEQLDVAGNMAVSGTILANAINPTGFLTIAAQNSSGEGGEIQLEGSGGFGNVQIDNFGGMLRLNPSPNSNGHEIVQVTSSELQITSSSAFNTHFNYQNTGVNFITVANSGYTTFRSSSNNTNALIVEGSGVVKIPSGTLRVGENSTSQAYGFSNGYVQTIQATSGGQTYLSIARPGVSMDNNGLIIGEDNSNSYILQRNNKNLILATNDQNVVIVSPSVNGTGRKGLQLADNSLAFDESGVRSWEMRANSGILRVDPGDGYGKMQVNAGVKAKFIQMTSDANDTTFAPQIQGYLGSQLSDGLSAVYYLGHLGSGSSSNASANWVSFYTSGHWGQYTQLVLWGITAYYNPGFSKWHISGTTATQLHGWGTQPSISISQTTVGSGTHGGQSVYRYNITLTNPGTYFGVRWFVGLVGGGGAGHLGSSRSEADADAWFSTRGGGLHLKNCSDANISASPLYNSGV